jgi:2-oxoglutarate dehydrogenase E2 component (dihydrolipoamide succinyltransferase)
MDVVMPQLGETVEQGTVAAWHKAVGDRVEKNEPLFDLETDKVETEIPAPASGVLSSILVPAGETVKVGARLAVIDVDGEARRARPAAGIPSPQGGRERLSPVVRRLLEEHQLDAASIAGTGAEGRITREDVLAYLERVRRELPPPRTAEESEDITVPMSRIRTLTAARMARSAAVSPHVLQAVEVDFSNVDEARRGAAGISTAGRPSLTYLPFVARAVCEAIREFPHINASVSGSSLLVHRRVNLGIAVDLSFEGVVVPVVKDAQRKPVRQLAAEMHALAEKARRGALGSDEVAGGTYTLSNSGAFGTFITSPIIHQPQVAILSTDAVRKKPVVVHGPDGYCIAIRPVGVLAQCFDHRAFDGAYSAAFLGCVKDILERRDWSVELA